MEGKGTEQKEMDCIQSTSLRDMVNRVNAFGIRKEDIVQIVSRDESFFLLYYK